MPEYDGIHNGSICIQLYAIDEIPHYCMRSAKLHTIVCVPRVWPSSGSERHGWPPGRHDRAALRRCQRSGRRHRFRRPIPSATRCRPPPWQGGSCERLDPRIASGRRFRSDALSVTGTARSVTNMNKWTWTRTMRLHSFAASRPIGGWPWSGPAPDQDPRDTG